MIRGKLKRTASYLLSAALLLSNMGGAAPALADAVVQEATPSGAECQHPNAKSEQIQEWGDVRSVGSNTHHQHQIKNYERWVCPDCEKEVAKDYVGEEWVDEAHSYANGVCSACGFGCTHTDKQNVGDPIEEAGAWYDTPLGNHSRYVDVYQQWVCPDCGVTGKDHVGGEEQSGEHTYADGVCTVCGYACSHTNKQNDGDPIEEAEAWQNAPWMNGHCRNVTMYQQWICSDCGITGKDYVNGETQYKEHTYSDSVCTACGAVCTHSFNANGVCTFCGYVCPHTEKETRIGSEIDENGFVSVDNLNHRYTYNQYEYWTCLTCHATGHGDALSTQQIEERHQYDQNDVCTVCGHQNDCQHADAIPLSYYQPLTDWADDGNSRTHSRTDMLYQGWRCTECGKRYDEAKGEEIHTELHQVDRQKPGVCAICRAETGCTHPFLINQRERLSCNNWKDDGNGLTHSGTVERAHVGNCSNCGEYVVTVVEKDVPVTEKHQYDGGETCVVCGGQPVCQHSEVEESIEYEDAHSPVDNGDGTHSWLKKVVKVTTCKACGYVVKTPTDEIVRYTEKHPQQPCSECGYNSGETCKHTNTYNKYVAPESGTLKPNADGKTHSGTMTLRMYVHCADCDAQVGAGEPLQVTVTDEPHEIDLNRGVCRLCSYILPKEELCKHEKTMTDVVEQMGRTTIVNENEHTIKFEVMKKTYCIQCGAVLKREFIESDELVTEPHEFDGNGICYVCRYQQNAEQTACKHAHTHTDSHIVKTLNIVSTNDKQHVLDAVVVDEVRCEDCDNQLSVGNMRRETLTEDHLFIPSKRDVCYICAYANTCTHANAVTEDEYLSVTNMHALDGKQHAFTAYGLTKTTYCPDCDIILGQELVDVAKHEVVEEHRALEGETMCGVCGAKIAEETQTPKPEVTPSPTESTAPVETPVPTESAAPVETPVPTESTVPTETPAPTVEVTATPAPTATPTPAPEDSGDNDNNFVPTPVPAATRAPTATVEPTATPEPAATPEPVASEEMNQAFEALDKIDKVVEEAVEVKIEIIGMDEIVPEETIARVQQLSVKEQIFMTLAAADCGAAAQSIINSMNIALSDSGKELFAELNTAPVEEQKMTEVRERLTELFPAHVIMRDNVYYHVNVMTVKMTVDGVEQTYYFGLRLDEFGLWQMIELAENEVGEETLVQK